MWKNLSTHAPKNQDPAKLNGFSSKKPNLDESQSPES